MRLLAGVLVPDQRKAADATLGITKTADVSTVQPGDAVSYSIQLTCSKVDVRLRWRDHHGCPPQTLSHVAAPSNSASKVTYDQNRAP